MADRFGAQDALFTAKCFVAAMLAYYIALRIGLTRPYWAVTTSYIVAQPLAGAVLSKAVFRVIGTIMGAVAAVILVPNLVNAPELLALALALWLAICLYISLLDRTPRAYMFLLAGYTASIIGFPSVLAPGEIFTTSVLRVEEITIGILCGSLIHGLVFPRSVTSALLARVDAILADAERWSRDSLAIESEEATLDRDRRRLALDINELHQLSIHLPFDTARLLPRVRTLRALQAELSMLLPLASAVDDRIAELARGSDAPRPEALALIEDVRTWLRDPPASLVERTDSADRLIERARLLEPVESLIWRDALRLSLLARLGELVDAHRNARDLRDQLRSPSRAPVTSAVSRLLARSNRRVLHRDHGQAIRSGFGTVATILLGCAFWIGTGWADGAGAVLIAGVCCALFGASDDPAPTIMQFLYGTIIGLSVSSVYAFAILPRVTDFVTLAAVLAPPLLLGGMFMARPGTMLLALGAMLGGINTVGLNDRFGESFAVFLNGGLAQLAGTFFAVVTVRLFQTVGAETSARRLIRAGWRDLARRSDLPGRPDPVGWISKMLDRIGLLAPRLAAQGQDPGKPLLDALADLRVGVAVAELRQLRIDGTAAEGALVSPVLSGVGRHYRALRPDEPAPPEPVLLNAIDGALAGLSGERRRSGVLALTSLRRNLFPSAPAYEVAA